MTCGHKAYVMDNLISRTGDAPEVNGHASVDVTRYSNDWIGVRNFGDKGRGVVALRDIPAGTVIERCPVLIIPEQDRVQTDSTIVFTYFYMWEHGTTEQDLYTGKGRAGIALGMSSLVNHSENPTATFTRRIDELEIELRSRVAIAAGEEVTIDYQMQLWFDPS
jgi:SET domain-containing protein